MDCPLDYSLCDRTVTVYRRLEEGVHRKVLKKAAFTYQDAERTGDYGPCAVRTFLLIAPGDQDLQPGDRICAGEGPEEVDWEYFVPALVDGLCQVAYVQPMLWNGRVCHVEAGRR